MGQGFLPREAEEKHPTGSRHLRTSKSVCGPLVLTKALPPGRPTMRHRSLTSCCFGSRKEEKVPRMKLVLLSRFILVQIWIDPVESSPGRFHGHENKTSYVAAGQQIHGDGGRFFMPGSARKEHGAG